MKTITFVLAALIALASIPAHAATPTWTPVIVQIGQTQQTQSASPQQGANKVYLPLVGNEKCYRLIALDDRPDGCGSLSAFYGAQSIAGYVVTVNNGIPQLYQTDLPQHQISLPVSRIQVGAQPQTPVSAQRIKLTSMAYITATGALASGVDASNPMFARLVWTLTKALQTLDHPTKLFPVSILTPHYTQAHVSAVWTTLFDKCGNLFGPGQFALPGYPYDLSTDDAMALSGDIWLAMKYPSCPAMDPTPWIHLMDFWRYLNTQPGYENIDREAQAMVGPTTYHAAVQVMNPQGAISTIDAIIIVTVVGGIVLIAIFPPASFGFGWWLLAGAAL